MLCHNYQKSNALDVNEINLTLLISLMITAKTYHLIITHLNQDTANRMWWAVRNHLGYLGTSNTHGLYVLRHTVASRLVSLKGFNAHKLMAFMGHTDIKSSLHYVHLNVDDIRDGVGVGV